MAPANRPSMYQPEVGVEGARYPSFNPSDAGLHSEGGAGGSWGSPSKKLAPGEGGRSPGDLLAFSVHRQPSGLEGGRVAGSHYVPEPAESGHRQSF